MSVTFANSALVQKSTDAESVEKNIDFTVNLNVSLQFGDILDIIQSLFFLILL